MTSTSKDPAVSELDVYGAILDGVGEFGDENYDLSELRTQLDEALKKSDGLLEQLSHADRLGIKQFVSRAGDPILQEQIYKSYDAIQQRLKDALSAAKSEAATTGKTLSNLEMLNNVLSKLGKVGGLVGTIYTADQISEAYQSGDMKKLGLELAKAVGVTAGITVVSLFAEAVALPGEVVVGAVALASLAISSFIEKYIPDELIESLGDWTDAAIDSTFGFLEDQIPRLGSFIESSAAAISDEVNGWYTSARDWVRHYDPLALDLDGDGIETLGKAGYEGVLFDNNGDGVKVATGWVGADDGLLALDRDGDGAITSGRELFGDRTQLSDGTTAADGFQALADLDQNLDGVVNGEDSRFADLRVWQDANGDGISEADELHSLDSLGITSLAVGTAEDINNALGNGNEVARSAAYTRSDGTQAALSDLNFGKNAFYRVYSSDVALTDAAKSLPVMQGSGQVRDLQQAASLSPDFASIVSEYANAPTRSAQYALLGDLVHGWAATSDMESYAELKSAEGYSVQYQFGDIGPSDPEYAQWVDRLATFEKFNGGIIESRFASISGDTIQVNLSNAQMDMLSSGYEALRQSVYEGLLLQTRLRAFADAVQVVRSESGGLSLDYSGVETVASSRIDADAAEGTLDLIEFSLASSDVLSGADWDNWGFLGQKLQNLSLTDDAQSVLTEFNIKFLGSGEQSITGDSSAERLLGNQGDNTVSGGDGNDLLAGGYGADTLHGGNDNDTLQGGAGDDLLYGDNNNDTLDGGDGADMLDGGAGTDVLRGGAGDDIVGGAHYSDDWYSSGDTLDGGAGNDTLRGSRYGETYLFGLGGGQDRIDEYGYSGTDVLRFGEGIAQDQLWFTQIGEDLNISIIGTGEAVTVANWYSDPAHSHLEKIQVDDSQVLLDTQVQQLVQAMASFDPPPSGQTTLSPEMQEQLEPVIAVAWQTSAA